MSTTSTLNEKAFSIWNVDDGNEEINIDYPLRYRSIMKTI